MIKEKELRDGLIRFLDWALIDVGLDEEKIDTLKSSVNELFNEINRRKREMDKLEEMYVQERLKNRELKALNRALNIELEILRERLGNANKNAQDLSNMYTMATTELDRIKKNIQ